MRSASYSTAGVKRRVGRGPGYAPAGCGAEQGAEHDDLLSTVKLRVLTGPGATRTSRTAVAGLPRRAPGRRRDEGARFVASEMSPPPFRFGLEAAHTVNNPGAAFCDRGAREVEGRNRGRRSLLPMNGVPWVPRAARRPYRPPLSSGLRRT